MTDDQELQLTDHPPLPWCRPSNVVELREAFARRERGEVCECGECPDAWDVPGSSLTFMASGSVAVSSNGSFVSLPGILSWHGSGWTWGGDGVDGHGRWFRLRRK